MFLVQSTLNDVARFLGVSFPSLYLGGQARYATAPSPQDRDGPNRLDPRLRERRPQTQNLHTPPARMPTLQDSRLRTQTLLVFTTIMVALIAGTSWYLMAAWNAQKHNTNQQLADTTQLTRVAVRNHLVRYAQALDFLGEQIQTADPTHDPAAARAMLLNVQHALHGLDALNLVAADGHLLASTALPTQGPDADQNAKPRLRAFLADLRAHPGQMRLWHPILSPLTQTLVLHIGRVVTGPQGARFYLVGGLSIATENALYRSLLPYRGWSQGLQLGVQDEHGYWYGRWPLPSKGDLNAFFTMPHSGAIHQAIAAHPASLRGVIAGALSADASGQPYVGAFRRLEGFPLVAFAVLPRAELRAAWWSQVRMPLAATAAVAVALTSLLFWSLAIQRRWVREAQTLLRQAEQAATERGQAAEQFIRILNDLPSGVLVFASDGRVQYCSGGFARMLEIAAHPRELIGRTWRMIWDLVEPLHVGGRDALAQVKVLFHEHQSAIDEAWLTDGRVMLRHYHPLLDKHGHSIGAMWIIQDVTEQKRQEDQIRQLAARDPLTGLPNRRAFEALLEATLHGNRSDLALGIADLDDFKTINDRLGHAAGDILLREVSRRLAHVLRRPNPSFQQRDVDFLARIGGDEFAMLLHHDQDPARLQRVAGRIMTAMREPIDLDGQLLSVRLSLGLAVRTATEDAQTLMRQADMALYAAKAAGRNQARVFNAEMQAAMDQREAWVAAIEQALQEHRLELFVQPILHARADSTGHSCIVTQAEALLRLRDAKGQVHAAAAFEFVLDDARITARVGRWVLDEAAGWLARWNAGGQMLSLAVNISPRHFLSAPFLDHVRTVLQSHPDLPEQSLVLELTERGTMLDSDTVRARIEACRLLGVQVSLDDFGTGNASLTHLQDLAVSTIKIDRRFIRDILQDAKALSITYGMVHTAQMLGVRVVAESVETPEQAQVLVAMGCTHLQGYAVAWPMPAVELTGWLRQWPQLLPWAVDLGRPNALGPDGIEAIVSLGTILRLLLTGSLDAIAREQLLAPDAHLRCTLGQWCQRRGRRLSHSPGFLRLTQQHLELHARTRQWIEHVNERAVLELQLQALSKAVRQSFWELALRPQAMA